MIFVTVGTHEQAFNRLLEEVDRLKKENLIEDEIIIQSGYSTYIPKHCQSMKLIGYDDMEKYLKEARIVITHGGPASFMQVIQLGKTPIVVPRQKQFDEHVNDHQLDFCLKVKKRGYSLEIVENINELYSAILNVKDCEGTKSNNEQFNIAFEKEVDKLFSKEDKVNEG